MTSKLPYILKSYGLLNGIKLYTHIKFKGKSPILFSFLKFPVYIRNIKSDILTFEQIFVNKEYDIKVPFEPKIIVDLGANVGYASILFANRFPKAKIFALEPEENNFDIAKKNVELYPNITLLRGAVWDKSEQINIVDKGYGEAAYIVEKGRGEHTVKAYTIPELMHLAGENYIDILKIDIEGSEKEIFENGFEEWIPYTKIIVIETHDRYKPGTSKAVFNTIGKYDFSLEISGENLLLYNNALVNSTINYSSITDNERRVF